MADRFIWPSIKADTARWARECIPCQQAKVTRHVTPPIGTFEVPPRRFSHLNLDIVALPSSNGFNHLLTIVDRLTRWPVAIPMTNITAETVADAFAQGWVATYGIPVAITTDRGSQFSSSIWTQLMEQWGIRPMMTSAYHPEANGLVERLHRRLKEAILALCPDSPNQWFWKLPLALLAIRTTLKPDIGASPADMVFGEGLALPGDLLQANHPVDDQLQRQQANILANLRVEVARLQPTPTSAHRTPRVFIPLELQSASHVFVKRGGVQPSLRTPYEGPYKVASRTPTGFHVHLPGGRTELITLNRLKPAHISTDQPADEDPQDLDDHRPPSPPPPGRQPGIRTRIPQPTSRQTRSSTRRQQLSDDPAPPGGPPATSPPSESPSTSDTRPQSTPEPVQERPRRRVRNIDEYGPPPASVPPTTSTSVSIPAAPPATSSGSEPIVGDPEPNRETNFFAPLDASPSPVEVGEQQENSSPRLTSALRTSRTPSGARVRFFSDDRRDLQQPRRFFSDYRRPRPDVSAISSTILSHLSAS